MAIADLGGFQRIDGGGDGRHQILRLFGAGADSAPVEEEAGALQVQRNQQSRGDEIGQRLGDAEFGLGEHGAIAAGVFQYQRPRRSGCGRAGPVVGGKTRGGQRQLNSDTASELSRRPFPHWAGTRPRAAG